MSVHQLFVISLLAGTFLCCFEDFDNRFDNRVERTATVRSTSSQTGLHNWYDNRLCHVYSQLSNGFDNRFDNRLYGVNGA